MMGLYEILELDFEHKDDRGKLTQLVHSGFKQVNVLETKKGVTRGGHYHKTCKEAFFVVSGCVEVEFFRENRHEKKLFEAGTFFLVNPLTYHSMFFPTDCIMVQMYDNPVEASDGTKDIHS